MLTICKTFFSALNEAGVGYCHWKSNEHLEAAVNGKTDLDVLVRVKDKDLFEAAMRRFDFKKILSQPDKQFPGLEDYLGFDNATGALVHLHVHYQLILGQKYIKNHHLPLESLYFSNLTQKLGVNIPCPELELIILIIRAHLKTDLLSLVKHAIKDILGANYTAFPQDIEREFHELYKKIDPEKFARILEESDLPLDFEWCKKFLDRLDRHKLRAHQILFGHYMVRARLRPYKRRGGIAVSLMFFRHFLSNSSVGRRLLSPVGKTLPNSGRAFAFVGADGSGKSTLTAELARWLSWKLTVCSSYYGIPKNWVSKSASLLMRLFIKVRLTRLAEHTSNLFWIYVAKYRLSVSRQIAQDVAAGKVAIIDRFPMSEFQGMAEPMDNPRIKRGATLFGKELQQREASYYNEISFPDKIIVLKVDLEELRKRKTDIDLSRHSRKAKAVNDIASREGVALLNANKPYEQVLLEAKKVIWDSL